MFLKFLGVFGFSLCCLAQTGSAWEVTSGAKSTQESYWQRDSIATGREHTVTTKESLQWNHFRMGVGRQEWSITKDKKTTEQFNQSKTLLARRQVEQWTPKFTLKTENVELTLGRLFEQVTPLEGTYTGTTASSKGYNQDFFELKVEKNREFFQISSGVDEDQVLAPSSQLEQNYYQWHKFSAGSYNLQLQGWNLWVKRHRKVFPKVINAQMNWLSGFQYYNEQPAKPNPDAYWKYLRFSLENFMVGNTKGAQLQLESAFSMIGLNAQHSIAYQLRVRGLKTSYDVTSFDSPYRQTTAGAEIRNQLAYLGEAQLFSSPLLLHWGYSYSDTPLVSDYRKDTATLGVKFNY